MAYFLLDPPMGWQFGFPKPYVGELEKLDWDAWLLANGYPAELIEVYPSGRHCRILGPMDEDSGTATTDNKTLQNL